MVWLTFVLLLDFAHLLFVSSEIPEDRVVPSDKPGADGAYSNCPCAKLAISMLEYPVLNHTYEMNGAVYRNNSMNLTLPASYGFDFCHDWDQIMPECKLSSPPRYCPAKWCYVDWSCRRPKRDSAVLRNIFYSYSTCGSVEEFDTSWWGGEDRSPVYAYAFGNRISLEDASDDDSTSTLKRRILQFTYYAMRDADFDPHLVVYKNLSAASRATRPNSSYAACLKDISLGNIDLCVGDMWDTHDRRLIRYTLFSGNVFSEDNYMVGPRRVQESDEGFFDNLAYHMRRPFRPFSWDLWGLIFVVTLVNGLAIAAFEFRREDSDFSAHSPAASVRKSIYLAFTSLLGASTSFNPVTPSGRIVSLGLGGFVLIVIASLTAETARFLIENTSSVQPVNNIEDALRLGHRICYPEGIHKSLEERFPTLKQKGELTAPKDTMKGIEDGKCDYAVIGETWMHTAWSMGYHCDMVIFGDVLASIPTGFYMSRRMQRLTASVAKVRDDGYWITLKNRIPYTDRCDAPEGHGSRRLAQHEDEKGKAGKFRRLKGADESSDSEPEPMQAKHMLGMTLLVGAMIISAVVVRVFEMLIYGVEQQDKELMYGASSTAHSMGAIAKDVTLATPRASMDHMRELRQAVKEELHAFKEATPIVNHVKTALREHFSDEGKGCPLNKKELQSTEEKARSKTLEL